MPYPQEYQIATLKFQDFLRDVKDIAFLGSGHMAYTMTQSVLQVFRRRLSLEDAIRFSNILPAGIRALFVADWDLAEPEKGFQERDDLLEEVQQLRREHNFAFLSDDAIRDVAKAMRRHVDEERLDALLRSFPEGASEFWQTSRHNGAHQNNTGG